jgi:hypothetical protein
VASPTDQSIEAPVNGFAAVSGTIMLHCLVHGANARCAVSRERYLSWHGFVVSAGCVCVGLRERHQPLFHLSSFIVRRRCGPAGDSSFLCDSVSPLDCRFVAGLCCRSFCFCSCCGSCCDFCCRSSGFDFDSCYRNSYFGSFARFLRSSSPSRRPAHPLHRPAGSPSAPAYPGPPASLVKAISTGSLRRCGLW